MAIGVAKYLRDCFFQVFFKYFFPKYFFLVVLWLLVYLPGFL
ncbi:hypothetical protein BN1224_CV14_A_04740 [Chlamydia pneumoniae]|uniref:Uncharacterized protein n=1 Tax=Chlamydia pneumoniae TaxID=83558 RepID=A0A0F7WS11_CHLPN|nr:hypothetical protein X556_0320 [Chlamydia pneumoniae B21]CRI32964.1 hypothetical protein BN1224_Wien1_A_04710 [Chlamydia pneumoniae]CRI35827.1 hypothetical protein BN1224_CM1_A_04740 [Chlamydia pneumoniae]CRI36955.1 hypothetical protein BN1224_CV14_A_04740 [Chlamydia pneumoniae]CRI38079.1 hypothetical protein BN1224_CV15_B_04020 [Chlamydia pneumoniae]